MPYTHVHTARQGRRIGGRRGSPGRARRRVRRAFTPAAAFSPLTRARTWAAAGYPQQNVLPVWPDNPNDASVAIGDMPYDEIAPKLNALQAASNRVSARVAGKSSGGYDLYAVTRDRAGDRRRGRAAGGLEAADRGRPGPRARRTPALLADYKTPMFINGNIHGNE